MILMTLRCGNGLITPPYFPVSQPLCWLAVVKDESMNDDYRYKNIGFTGMSIRPWKELVAVLKKHNKVLRVHSNDLILIDCHTAEELKEYIIKMKERENDANNNKL